MIPVIRCAFPKSTVTYVNGSSVVVVVVVLSHHLSGSLKVGERYKMVKRDIRFRLPSVNYHQSFGFHVMHQIVLQLII